MTDGAGFRISVAETDIAFACAPEESVLEAAERAGFTLPYSCRKGLCSTCFGDLVEGDAVIRGKGAVTGPRADATFCQTRPRSDLVIRPAWIQQGGPPPRRTLTARLFRMSQLAPDVWHLHLRFPNGIRAAFAAGQYLRILLDDGDSRNFSMANPPRENDGVELHVRQVPGGRFSEDMLGQLAPGSQLVVELAYGTFGLDPEREEPAILLASGTGFAPFSAIIRDQIARGGQRPLHLYWGARTERDLYLDALLRRWTATYAWLSYTPVLSAPDAPWAGRHGLVHAAVLADHPDLRAHDVYACGNPLMISAAQVDFAAAGLPDARFHSDAFVPSGEILP